MVTESPKPYDLLIADDNEEFREILREFLEPRPLLRVHEVESGERAIEYSLEFRIDIVLLDIVHNRDVWRFSDNMHLRGR